MWVPLKQSTWVQVLALFWHQLLANVHRGWQQGEGSSPTHMGHLDGVLSS